MHHIHNICDWFFTVKFFGLSPIVIFFIIPVGTYFALARQNKWFAIRAIGGILLYVAIWSIHQIIGPVFSGILGGLAMLLWISAALPATMNPKKV